MSRHHMCVVFCALIAQSVAESNGTFAKTKYMYGVVGDPRAAKGQNAQACTRHYGLCSRDVFMCCPDLECRNYGNTIFGWSWCQPPPHKCSGAIPLPYPASFQGSATPSMFSSEILSVTIRSVSGIDFSGVLDITGTGRWPISCLAKNFTQSEMLVPGQSDDDSGRKLHVDLADCIQSPLTIKDFRYCGNDNEPLILMTLEEAEGSTVSFWLAKTAERMMHI